MFEIKWDHRFDALSPIALLAFAGSAHRLKAKLLSLTDEKLHSLQGVAAENLLFISGATEDLPWVDGLIYLGRDARAPSILLPTNLLPSLPVDLFERKLLREFSAYKPFAVSGNRIIAIGKMRPVSRKVLSEAL